MEISLIDKITNRENLYWAWEKAKYFYKPGDVWFDEIELAGFEANLEEELNSIINDIIFGNYQLESFKPVGFPKSGIDENGNLKTRQTFWISVRDQITWIAVINIIGPLLDERMPFWSYGNRLHISVFYDEDENQNKSIRFGHYRNTSKHLLRKWNQSWPMFRKHIALTIKKMCGQPMDDREKEDEGINEQIKLKQLHCGYLDQGFWTSKVSNDLYWASIDFERFYPSAKIKTVRENIIKYLPADQVDNSFVKLLHSLTDFKIDKSGWNNKELKDSIQIETDYFDNIPTGLFASHFLANVLLLDTDLKAHELIVTNKNIAHFRFVDDHIILSHSFEDLVNWISWYKKELDNHSTGAIINFNKTEPSALRDYLTSLEYNNNNLDGELEAAKTSCKLDPEYPSPLMTQTLNKISKINETEFDLLDNDDKDRFIADLEHLLLAEFNDQEVRKDTRLSFAATILTRLVPRIIFNNSVIIDAESRLANLSYDLVLKNKKKIINAEDEAILVNSIEGLKHEIDSLRKSENLKYEALYKKTYKILLKVIYENFDKIRLWNRALEFCYNTGYNGLDDLVALIDKIRRENKASKLTLIFLKSFILQVLSNLALRSVKNMIDNYSSNFIKHNSEYFLNHLRKPEFGDKLKESDGKFYHTKAVILFEKTLDVVRFTLTKKEEINFKDSVLKNNEIETNVFDKFSSRESSWIWWFNSKLALDFYSPTKVWLKSIGDIDFESPIDVSLAYLYPKAISPAIFARLEKYINNEGWIFDLIQGNASFSSEDLRRFEKVKTVLSKIESNKKQITLYEWNNWLDKLDIILHRQYFDKNQGYYDTRLSEWTSLEIVRQITNLLISKISERPMVFESTEEEDIRESIFKLIHPNNYLIPDSWISETSNNISWQDWERTTLENSIQFNIEDKFILDNRYSITILDPYGEEDIEGSIVLGLGALLTCLLSRDFNLPAYWNANGHQRAWLYLIHTKLKLSHISSLTKQLLDSVFSKRNRETVLLNLFFPTKEYEFSEDTAIDPPQIVTLKDLHSFIVASQAILKKYRLNVQDNLPRQLIPVSFKQLTKQFQPFDDEEERE